MCSGTYVSVGPLLVDVGTDRLIATKWFCDSLLRYPSSGIVSTLLLLPRRDRGAFESTPKTKAESHQPREQLGPEPG
jgi:hypothetical protein